MMSSLVSEGRRRKKQFVPMSDPCAMLPSMKRQLFRNIIVLLIRTQFRICPTPSPPIEPKSRTRAAYDVSATRKRKETTPTFTHICTLETCNY
jgi:hypothetical protein